jgi:hypothetical protein
MRTSTTVGRLFDGLGEFAARIARRAGMLQGASAP